MYFSVTATDISEDLIKKAIAAFTEIIGTNSFNVFTLDGIPEEEEPDLEKDLAALLNSYSEENPSGTPDFILAEYLLGCLRVYNATIKSRARWRGESTELPALARLEKDTTPVKETD